jgi:hypothetical protein
VRAKYYGDGGWYAGVVLAQTGKGFYTVLFDGYEEDGPQVRVPEPATSPKPTQWNVTLRCAPKVSDLGRIARQL